MNPTYKFGKQSLCRKLGTSSHHWNQVYNLFLINRLSIFTNTGVRCTRYYETRIRKVIL